MFLELILFLIALLYLLHLLISWNWNHFAKRNIPYIKPKPFFGNFKDRIFMSNSFYDFDLNVYQHFKGERFGGYFELTVPILWIQDAELIKIITVKDFDHFVDRRSFAVESDVYSMEMLFNRQGQEWKDLRAIITPAFSSGKMKRIFENNIKKSVVSCVKYLKGTEATNESVEMKETFGRFAIDVVAGSAFGVQCDSFEESSATFVNMAHKLVYPEGLQTFYLAISTVLPKLASFLRLPVFQKEALSFFEELTMKNIEYRETTGVRSDDLLQLLLDVQKGNLEEDKEEDINKESTIHKQKKVELTNTSILAQSLLFFFAGYETTSSLLSFVAYELAMNPDVQDQLYEEIKQVVERHGGITYEALQDMEYMDMVISESHRKHPILTRLERQCTKEYQIPGSDVTLYPGDFVNFSIVGFNTDPKYYTNPEIFDPQRFSKEEKAKRSPYLTLGFGQGPRNCIGMRFATVNMKTILANVVYNFHLKTCDKTQIPLKYGHVTDILRPEKGVWLNMEERIQ